MKLLFSLIFSVFSFTLYAQPKNITQAIVNTITTVIAPEDEEIQNIGGGGEGGRMNFRNMMDGETKSTTYLKNGMVKTILKSEMGRSTIIRNNDTKMTTTLIEMMGTKTGFFVSDSEQVVLRRTADSMMQSRRAKDSTIKQRVKTDPLPVEVSYTEETKKIAGYQCKKAYVITTRLLGLKDSMTVWYTPEIKLQNVSSTGGFSGFGNMGSANGLDKVDGFVMRYDMSMPRNRRMEVEVTKIDLNKTVDESEFVVPKDFELKPMKEMQSMFGGGRGGFPRQ